MKIERTKPALKPVRGDVDAFIAGTPAAPVVTPETQASVVTVKKPGKRSTTRNIRSTYVFPPDVHFMAEKFMDLKAYPTRVSALIALIRKGGEVEGISLTEDEYKAMRTGKSYESSY